MKMSLWKLIALLFSVLFSIGLLVMIRILPPHISSVPPESVIPTENLCGPLSLLEVCRLYGVEASVEELAALSKTEAHGTSLEGLFEASQKKSLQPIALHMTVDELVKRIGPAILHVNDNHFWVVQKIEGDDVYILDPPRKPYIISKNRLSKMWDGNALCFEKPLPNLSDMSVQEQQEFIYDMGTIPIQYKVAHTFPLYNPEKNFYKVSDIAGSCSCSTASLKVGTIIPPKQKKLVNMEVSLPGKSGLFEESMKIYINDSKKPRYILTIKGILRQPLQLSPSVLYIGKVAKTEIVQRQVALIIPEDQIVQITSIDVSTPAIAVKVINEKQKSGKIILNVTVFAASLKNVFGNVVDEKITIYTNAPDVQKLELPVQGMILDIISCIPDAVFFGAVSKGQSTSRQVKVLVRDPHLKLVSVQSRSQFISVDWKASTDSEKYEIIATLLSTAPSGTLKTTIDLLTEPPHTQPLQIPVYALVK